MDLLMDTHLFIAKGGSASKSLQAYDTGAQFLHELRIIRTNWFTFTLIIESYSSYFLLPVMKNICLSVNLPKVKMFHLALQWGKGSSLG